MTALVAYLAFLSGGRPAKPGALPSHQPITFARRAHSLQELLKIPADELKGVDIAEMDLLCAEGLRGAEDLDADKALARLNDWAKRVEYWTDQSMWDFRRNPGQFKNSEAKFRVLLLISVLQKDFGVHYNDRGERNCDFSNAKNAFIHGMIDDPNGGTCASMPVMYVAVGRRLRYPMRLVLAKTHIFARWDDPKTGEHFNIEGTNPRFDDHPDSYYRSWPYPISDAELKQGWYLKSLTPPEELAAFLQNRACCLMDTGRRAEALAAYIHSYCLAPQNPLGPDQIASTGGRAPIGAGPIQRASSARLQRPQDPRLEVERINAFNRANMDRKGESPQDRQPPPIGPLQPRPP